MKDFMEQLNRVELRGVVGSVRLQTFEENNRMARISLATNYAYKDRDGIAVIDTSWHNVIAWEGRSIHDLDKISKGTKLQVQGRIRYQKYTGVDGVDRIATDILASRLNIVNDPEPMQYEM
jgi:single-strand DNA-binding protein